MTSKLSLSAQMENVESVVVVSATGDKEVFNNVAYVNMPMDNNGFYRIKGKDGKKEYNIWLPANKFAVIHENKRCKFIA